MPKEERERLTIAIAPSHDNVTNSLSKWLVRVANRLELEGHPAFDNTFFGPRAVRGDVRPLVATSLRSAFVVFYGHGEAHALLTGPGLGTSQSTDRDVLIHEGDFSADASHHVVAYSCASALRLGQRILDSGGAFVGFDEDIWIDFYDAATSAAFRQPMETLVLACCHRSSPGLEMPEDLDALIQCYEGEIGRWAGPLSGHDRALLMRVFLRGHVEALRRLRARL